jgi:transglutaminase-like putative cysteine protease
MDQSAFGAMVTGEAVCKGNAMVFLYFMQRLGIPCALVMGESRGTVHAWNLVRLGGEYYNIDVTWNTPANRSRTAFMYTYFNITDQQISGHHTRADVCLAFPAAEGTAYSFNNYGFIYGSDFSALDLELHRISADMQEGIARRFYAGVMKEQFLKVTRVFRLLFRIQT